MGNMKNIILIVILIIVLGVAFYFTRQYISNNPGGFFGRFEKMTIGDEEISVSLADTDEERVKGLSGKQSLPQNQGMLFLFDRPDYYGFWMKDMNFPIDIIFMNNGKVVTIHPKVSPPERSENLYIYKPDSPSNQVLELSSGRAEELGIKVGDTLTIPQ